MLSYINTNKKRSLIIASVGACLALAAGVGVVLYFGQKNNAGDTASTTTPSSSVNQATSQQTPTSSTSNASGPSSTSETTTESPSLDESITPVAPSGTFVSNHRPSTDSTYAITSTCSTTPGATCTIMFAQSDTTKSLRTKTADADGNASWTWTLQEIGLTQGEWKVSAVATNGTKSATTSDSLNLVVSQ